MYAPRKVVAVGGAIAVFSLLAAPAYAEITQWDHNGSLVRLEEKEKKVRFVYAQPRDGLGQAGVKQGTVLFDGELKADGRLAGYAKLFRKGCDPVDYFVEGSRDNTKQEILLQGQAPVYAGEGCKITGYTDEGSGSSLKFTRADPAGGVYAGGDLPGQDQPPERPGYLPPPSISGGAPEPDSDTADNDTRPPALAPPPAEPRSRSRAPAYAEPRAEERDYADRRDRHEGDAPRYERPYSPPYVREYDDYDAEAEEDYDDEPAYIPYQPFWRSY
jgi:hypothetical protein